MHPFQNILVGVELSHGTELLPPTLQAVRSAHWLAEKTSAELTFLSVLHSDPTVATEGALSSLVESARQAGLKARSLVARGNPADEILRQTARGGHDLVVIGGPAATGLTYRLAGSTATRLLHDCPCPLWLAVHGSTVPVWSLLVASDLTPASDNALRLGAALARSIRARAFALNVVSYPLDHHWSSGDRDSLTVTYHNQVREEARAALREQCERLGYPGEFEVLAVGRTEVTEVELLHFVRENKTDLLVLGMTGHGWLREKLFSHVAERVLPESPCSVLVVKPDGFHGAEGHA